MLAPTGTIGLMMDCDTTGIEPDLALVKFKKLVGGGSMQIVNQTVPRALRSLGYQEEQVEAIVEYIAEHGHVVDAPGLKPEHYAVFDCAMGERSIAPMGHVRMMAAVQPFISGAISKTVNMPESATVEDVEEIYFAGLEARPQGAGDLPRQLQGRPAAVRSRKKHGEGRRGRPRPRPSRRSSSTARSASGCRRSARRETVSFTVGGAEGYLTASSYPDDGLGEVFLKMSKQGSTLAGVMDAFSIAISIGLQYGVPLETYVGKFTNMRFEPAGMTDDPDIRMAAVGDGLHLPPPGAGLPAVRDAGPSSASSPPRSGPRRSGPRRPARPTSTWPTWPRRAPALRTEIRPAADAGARPPRRPSRRSRSARRPSCWRSCTGKAADAPLCFTCGTKMRPAGSCYVCEGCGSTSGCS